MRRLAGVVVLVGLTACGARELELGGTGGPGSGASTTPVSCADAGSGPVVLASGLIEPLKIAVSPSNVFWTDQFAVVGSVPLCGGQVTTLASLGGLLGGLPRRGFDRCLLVRRTARGDQLRERNELHVQRHGRRGRLRAGDRRRLLHRDRPLLPRVGVLPGGVLHGRDHDRAARWRHADDARLERERLRHRARLGEHLLDGPDGGGGHGRRLGERTGGRLFPGSAELWSVPLRGGSAKALTSWSGGGSPQSITVQGDYVYWVGDGIMKVSTRGGTPTVAVSAANGATAFAFDSTSVYWINPGPQCPLGGCNDTVMKASLDGSGVTTLASGITAPAAVAVDSANVYWLTRGLNGPTGSVMKLAK